jgi:MFS family permease
VAYAFIYLGFGLAQTAGQIWVLYALYGFYYGTAYGTAKALVADLVPAALRGTAYGTYNAVLGILDFPASAIAGILWQGIGGWPGFGPAAPFLLGGVLALLAGLLLGLSGIGRAPAPASATA